MAMKAAPPQGLPLQLTQPQQSTGLGTWTNPWPRAWPSSRLRRPTNKQRTQA